MSDWKGRIKQWAVSGDRNLIEGSTPRNQMDQLNEECGELYEGLLENNTDDTKDAIGDIQVVLCVMCHQLGLDIDECREIAYEKIKDRKGKMVDGVFVKEVQGAMSTPTLDELFGKFRCLLRDQEFTQHSESFEAYFRSVASGQAEPWLSDSNAVMAAQCVIVVLEHVKRMEAGR